MTLPLDEASPPEAPPTPAVADESKRKRRSAVIMRPRNRLKEKIGDFRVDDRMILRAHESLLRMREAFFERAAADTARLAALAADLGEIADPASIDEIKAIAHNIRGLGATFNYSMVTSIGDSLYKLADSGAAYAGPRLEVVRLHCQALCRVIDDRMEGNGGRLGAELIDSLAVAAAKVAL